MALRSVGLPFEDHTVAVSIFSSPEATIRLALDFQNSYALRPVKLVIDFCRLYGQAKYVEVVQKIASEEYEATNAFEHELFNAVIFHHPQFMLRLGRLLRSDIAACDFDGIQGGGAARQRSVVNSLAPFPRDPTLAPPLPPGKPSFPVQSIGSDEAFASPIPRPGDCAKFTVRGAIKCCPFCPKQIDGYGMKEHIQACKEYPGNYGDIRNPDVVDYINKVWALLHCSSCGGWFRGHHKALQHKPEKESPARYSNSDIIQDTAAWVPTTAEGPPSSYTYRAPPDLATSGFFRQYPSAYDLQGNHAFASIDAAAQEASDHPSGSGQRRYPVASIPNSPQTGYTNSIPAGMKVDQMINDFDTYQQQHY